MRAFVTGGTGFIGSRVVDLLLDEGHAVRLLSRRPGVPERWSGKEIAVVEGDLRDADGVLDAMKGADVVFHIGEVRNTSSGKASMNADLAERMAVRVQPAGVQRLVFVSSITVAGIPRTVPATEDTPAARVLGDQYTDYKRKAEEAIRRSCGTVEQVIVRPGVVYGPGSRYLGRLVDAVRHFGPFGLPFVGSGDNLMPLVHVRDLARAIVLAGTARDAANRTFNLTDGERRTWREFFSAIAAAKGRRLRLIPVPPVFAKTPARFADLFTGLLGQSLDLASLVAYLSRDVHFGNEAARAALGWEPERKDLSEAVRDMVAWYETRKQDGGF